jgi:hypothetical protein
MTLPDGPVRTTEFACAKDFAVGGEELEIAGRRNRRALTLLGAECAGVSGRRRAPGVARYDVQDDPDGVW